MHRLGADDAGQGVGYLSGEDRWRIGKGGGWPVGASCVLVGGEERWVLDGLP